MISEMCTVDIRGIAGVIPRHRVFISVHNSPCLSVELLVLPQNNSFLKLFLLSHFPELNNMTVACVWGGVGRDFLG